MCHPVFSHRRTGESRSNTMAAGRVVCVVDGIGVRIFHHIINLNEDVFALRMGAHRREVDIFGDAADGHSQPIGFPVIKQSVAVAIGPCALFAIRVLTTRRTCSRTAES